MHRGPDPAYRVLSLMLTAPLLLVGCATGGPVETRDAPKVGARDTVPSNADELPPHRKLGYRLEWRGFPVVADRAEIEAVDIYDDLITVRDSVNTLSAIEVGTGTNRWALQAGGRLDRIIGTARTPDGGVIVSADTELAVYDAKSGALSDRQDYDLLTSTPPATVDRFICVGGENGQLLIHNLTSGFRQHAYDFGATIQVAPVAIDGLVGAVARNGRVFIIDPKTGSSVGRTRVYASADVPPAASATAMFVASRDQSLWAFEARGAKTRWRVRTEGPLTHAPVYAGGVVYCVIPGEGLTAFDALSGERLWVVRSVFADAVCKRGDRIIAWDGSRIYAIHADAGDVMDSFELPGVSMVKADTFDEGNLYTISVRDEEIRKHAPIR